MRAYSELISLLDLILVCSTTVGQSSSQPRYHYLNDFVFNDTSLIKLNGPASGRMVMIYAEDVRSYHWEYYQEMADMRNDLDNSAFMKQPWNYPMAFATRNVALTRDTWHKLQFLQIDNKLVGAIDGVVMFECTDDGFTNNGPVLDFGHIAIRCMLRTKMVFRNLKVYNKERIKTEKIIDRETLSANDL